MEVTKQDIHWLDESHPNYERWKRAREIAVQRGEFVKSVIRKVITPEGLNILDLGSGEGGTSIAFAEDNSVVSFDLSKVRLLRQQNGTGNFNKVFGNAKLLPFKNNTFDLIILQDVIEHIDKREEIVIELNRILKNSGVIYLSTPNKLSLINIISDPHWGLPIVSLLKRESIKKYYLKKFRPQDYDRSDIAVLLSFNQIKKMFEDKFELRLFTKHSVTELFNGNKGIVWSDFHLRLISFVRKIKLHKLILAIANDKQGFINKFLTPTYYFILIKKSEGDI